METIQSSFSSGELAPSLHGQVNTEKYLRGLKTCRNFIVRSHGGVDNRPGSDFVGSSKDHSKQARLIPFEFNTVQTYALEFGDLYMRVVKDGAHVLEPSVNITGATNANPVVVTAVAHGYSNGDEVFIDSVGGMTEINNKRFIAANVAANTFELQGIDGTGYGVYTTGGTVSRIFTLVTPYLEADLRRLKYSQSNDVMVLTHPSYHQKELTRTSHYAWTITDLNFAPEIATPTGLAATGTGVTYYKITAVAEETYEESLPTAEVDGGATPVTLSWTDPGSGIERWNIYKKDTAAGNEVFGYIGYAETNSFIDTGLTPVADDNPPKARDPFNAADDYPACAAFFEQRLGLAGTNNKPQTYWMTQLGHYKNMGIHFPLQDDDSITATINSLQVNEIRALVPLEDLIVMTAGGEWKIGSGESPFTATTMRVRQQGSVGSSHVRPIVIGDTILFVQAAGNSVRDFSYVDGSGSYKGADLSVLANHLFYGREVVEWAYAQRPYSVIWCVLDNGVLLGLTYVKELDVWAWHRHDTDGYYESACSIKEGDEDAVYFIVKRTVNGSTVRYVERFHSRVFEYIEDAFHVDSGLSYGTPINISGATQANPVVITATGHGLSSGQEVRITHVDGMTELNQNYYKIANPTANTFELQDADSNDIDGTGFEAYTSGGEVRATAQTFTGLEHLEGETVKILADGSVQPSVMVSNGSITIQRAASEVHVGLEYYSDLELLDLTLPVEAYGQSKKKKVSRVSLKVEKSRGFWAGPDVDNLTEFKQRVDEPYGHPTEMTTGIQEIIITPEWNSNGRVFIRQKDPLPISILAAIPEVESGD